MEDNKKICPFCGAEINKDAKKCRFCNNWLDEEIKCPYCAETIKASAKKCRFCGEWLDNEHYESMSKKTTDEKGSKEKFIRFNFLQNQKINLAFGWVVLSVVIFLVIVMVFFITHIPSCKSRGMQEKLKEYLTSNYSDMGEISLDKASAHKIKRIEKGYACSINATIDNAPTHIEYSYKKVSLSEYDINAKFVLPNCFDSSVKTLLSDLIKGYDGYNIKNNTSGVYTNNEAQNNYDKDSITYSCAAEATLTSKPGKAYLLNSWDYDDATRTIKCNVDYRTFFCKNGYTTCVGLNDIYGCKYKDDK